MPFSENSFVRLRPYLYHNTSRNNLEHIVRCRQLLSAARLLEISGNEALHPTQRTEARSIILGEDLISLQTQWPLQEGHIAFQGECTLQQFVKLLDRKVFFWPGGVEGPIRNGVGHKTSKNGPAQPTTLRVESSSLIPLNTSGRAQYCAYNSGSPRTSRGIKSPRGSDTFLDSVAFTGNAGDVIEIVFDNCVDLPPSTQVWVDETHRWDPLF